MKYSYHLAHPDSSINHSYGFRPGYNQQQAVEVAQKVEKGGKEYVINNDFSKFFDQVNRDSIICIISCHVNDKRILGLSGMILRSGVMVNGVVHLTEEGTVLVSSLRLLLSNVVLGELYPGWNN